MKLGAISTSSSRNSVYGVRTTLTAAFRCALNACLLLTTTRTVESALIFSGTCARSNTETMISRGCNDCPRLRDSIVSDKTLGLLAEHTTTVVFTTPTSFCPGRPFHKLCLPADRPINTLQPRLAHKTAPT